MENCLILVLWRGRLSFLLVMPSEPFEFITSILSGTVGFCLDLLVHLSIAGYSRSIIGIDLEWHRFIHTNNHIFNLKISNRVLQRCNAAERRNVMIIALALTLSRRMFMSLFACMFGIHQNMSKWNNWNILRMENEKETWRRREKGTNMLNTPSKYPINTYLKQK